MGKRKKRFKGYKAPKGGRLPGNVGTILDSKKEEHYGFLADEQGIRSESGKVLFKTKEVIEKAEEIVEEKQVQENNEEVTDANPIGEVNIPSETINTDNANNTSEEDIWKF